MASTSNGLWPIRYGLRPRMAASALSPPPPISPRPIKPSSVSTSTMVRTKRPQWAPEACCRAASSGTVTVVARMSTIFTGTLLRQDGGELGGEGTVDLELAAGNEGGAIADQECDKLG